MLGYLTGPLSARDERVFPGLTDREREVLGLVAAGLSNGQIATRLSLSTKTVRNNISSIFGKLQVADRAEAIVRPGALVSGCRPASPAEVNDH